METRSWLWPDRVIGKRESRTPREEHNILVNKYATLARATRRLLTCVGDPNGPMDDAVAAVRQALEA
jgi:hypothetical protein